MQATCRQKQGTLDYFETDWMPRESEAAQAFVELAAIRLASSGLGEAQALGAGHTNIGNLAAGHCRMNMSQSRHMARKVAGLDEDVTYQSQGGRVYVDTRHGRSHKPIFFSRMNMLACGTALPQGTAE